MVFDFDYDDVPLSVREDDCRERDRAARMNHWCSDCHGFTGPGSPCAMDEETDEQGDEE